MRVYIILIHKQGERPWIHSVVDTREKAESRCYRINKHKKGIKKDEWADYIGEDVE